MTRWTPTVALVAVLCCMASGAVAGDGYFQKVITFTPGTIDTASYLDGADDTVNDSLIFYSPTFGVTQAWTVCKARLFYKTVDTTSTIDTIGYEIQSKFDSPYDSTWWKIGGVAKKEEDVMNTKADSMTSTTYFDADTMGIGNLFRVKFALIAEEAEWRDVAAAGPGGGLLPLNAIYILYLMFVENSYP
jgi:hypothetical protein